MMCLSYTALLFILLSTQSIYFAAALRYWASKTLCLYSVCVEHVCSWHVTKQCPPSSNVTFGYMRWQTRARHCMSLCIVVYTDLQHLLGEFLSFVTSFMFITDIKGCDGISHHVFFSQNQWNLCLWAKVVVPLIKNIVRIQSINMLYFLVDIFLNCSRI